MLKFANLSMAQKKCVVALIEADSSLTKTGQITLKQVSTITQSLAAKRASGGTKIGYPNWLFNKNKVERGVYQLPVPTETEMTAFNKEVADKKTAPVAKAKAKVAKLAKAKTVKVKTAKADVAEKEDALGSSRLQKIIDDSVEFDDDVEDFNAILRENGIEV